MPKPLIILGAGTGGRFVRDICDACGVPVRGYLDDFKPRSESVNGLPILGTTGLMDDGDFLNEFQFTSTFGDQRLRARWGRTILRRQGLLATLVHPSCVVAPSANLGKGLIVNAFSYIHANARIGDHSTIENHSSIGIDNVIGEAAHIATACALNAFVTCGDFVFIGSGVTVNPRTTIGSGGMIGAGAVVTSDIPDGKLAVGVPARVIKKAPSGVG